MSRPVLRDAQAPRDIFDLGLVPDDIENHPDLARKHCRELRAAMVADGSIVPDRHGGHGLYEPHWLRELMAEMPCLTLHAGVTS